MWTDHEWESAEMSAGRYRCKEDLRQGEMFNPYKQGTPEWKGYQDEMNHVRFVEDHLTAAADRIGI